MNSVMNKIGLALSGGGFRASLYHLGVVRFLRDAGILSQVSHITSVSGGSIFAAHLVLNWDRYNGSAEDFHAAASELIAFVRLDVRNRILRRFPFTLPLRWLGRLLGLPTRKLSRTGLMEQNVLDERDGTDQCDPAENAGLEGQARRQADAVRTLRRPDGTH